MTSLLDTKIREILDRKDIILTDYAQVDENTTIFGLEFHRIRGSVRMTAENVLLPFEVIEDRKNLLHLDFA